MTKPDSTDKLLTDPEAKLLAVLKAEEYRGLAIRANDRGQTLLLRASRSDFEPKRL
jgi:hypothetical protein